MKHLPPLVWIPVNTVSLHDTISHDLVVSAHQTFTSYLHIWQGGGGWGERAPSQGDEIQNHHHQQHYHHHPAAGIAALNKHCWLNLMPSPREANFLPEILRRI